MEIKRALYEVNFINKYSVEKGLDYHGWDDESIEKVAHKIDPKLLEQFYTKIDPFWHTENDILEVFIMFSNNTYLCQRRKLRYDFDTKTHYWQTYNFNSAPLEKVLEFCEQVEAFLLLNIEVRRFNAIKTVEELGEESIFFERRYYKRMQEKNMMISATDWRVLPDIEDSYPGEKDMWIKWRKTMREDLLKPPTEFENKLDFLQYLYELKYPIDPKIYWAKYPNGEVGYLETEDQWTDYDAEASTDYVASRLPNILNFSKKYITVERKVKASVLKFFKEFGINEIYEDFDLSRFVEDSEEK